MSDSQMTIGGQPMTPSDTFGVINPATGDVFAQAHCYKMTKTIAFVRATAYHDTPDDPVAAASGTFMRHKMGGISL